MHMHILRLPALRVNMLLQKNRYAPARKHNSRQAFLPFANQVVRMISPKRLVRTRVCRASSLLDAFSRQKDAISQVWRVSQMMPVCPTLLKTKLGGAEHG